MFQRDNGREDQSDNKSVNQERDEALAGQGENVQKVFDDVQDLKEKIERLKAQTEKLADTPVKEIASGEFSVAEKPTETKLDEEAVLAAERAVIEHARWDAESEFADIHKKEADKELKIKEAKIREMEARERLLQKQREAEEKRKALKEAEKIAAESRIRRQEIEKKSEANQNILQEEHRKAVEKQETEARKLKDIQKKIEKEKLEAERRAAIELRRERERLARLEAEKQRRIAREQAAEEKRQAEAEKKRQAEEKRKAKEAERLAAIERKNEAARKKLEEQKEAQRKKYERARLIAEQREIQRKKREAEKAEQRRLKKIQEDRKNEDRRLRKEAVKKKRAERKEIKRQQRVAEALAKKGGGIVSVHGQTVQTEIQPVPAFSLRDLLGTSKRREIRATTSEEEKLRLQAESERIRNEATRTAEALAAARIERRKTNPVVAKACNFLNFCDEKKKPLLIAFTIILVFAVGTAAAFNYCTAYEYSYNGNQLGYVKNKDDVLQITEMVQGALSEEKNVDVVIDARDDIQFRRVYTLNKDIMIDSSDDVLKRLTYLNEINVKAYGIFLDGQKIGAVKDKDTAAKVFEDIKDRYASNKKGAKIIEAVVIEKVDARKSNTPLGDVLSEKQMVDRLCTDSVKETVVTVERGQTLKEIAKVHSVKEKDIIKDNPGINPEKLVVGSTLIIHETAPLMTVQITEERTYVEKTPYETIKKKDKDLYEGYTEVDQKGHKGLSQITDRTVSINGSVVETENLKNKVEQKPVEKIVRVGTKERPPTVGSGTYIWPANPGTYTVTSEFKWRWGRQHQGIDMGCATGNDVLAADGGTVVHAGWMGGYGNLVIIDHQNGIQTYYAHNSQLLVSVGDKVFQGQHIAEAGNTGNSFGSHIHFGVMDHGEFKNPRNYLP
ncbi:MAG: peptidoglycan DD-metalloendopeptidase family protein [Clostridia bacterium]|nr:peptidoglycan DD-metalloendopeptidase family protein [Clostridia bacterium]